MTSFTFGVGKGLKESASPYRVVMVFGAELNSPDASDFQSPAVIVSPTVDFNLSTITKNHEVVVALLTVQGCRAGNHTFNFRWVRSRDNKLLFNFVGSATIPEGGWVSGYSFIGWLDSEINENGGYQVNVQLSGADSYATGQTFNVIGIPSEAPGLPPPVSLPATIIEAFNSVADYFHSLYLNTYGWVYPFDYISTPFYYLSLLFSNIAWAFSDLITLVNALVAQVANVLSWDYIKSLIRGWLPWLENAGTWFQSWWSNIWNEVGTWWNTVSPTVQGWISAAVQPFNTMLTAWNGFWNSTWPQLTSRFDSLKADWDNFWRVTFPTLVSFDWLETWWFSRLLDVQGLINGAFTARASLWSGWQDMRDNVVNFFTNPVEYIWNRFTDWFLGPEG